MSNVSIIQPAAPSEGEIWYDTKENALKLYVQDGWVTVQENDYELLNRKAW